MPCDAFKTDGRRCQHDPVPNPTTPAHLHFCTLHNRCYDQRVVRALGIHHQPGRCQSFDNQAWCPSLCREGSVFCATHHARNDRFLANALNRERVRDLLRTTVDRLMAVQPPPPWREVVQLFVPDPDPDNILYQAGMEFFIRRYGGHIDEFRQYWIWLEGGGHGPVPEFVPPPVVHVPRTHPVEDRELARIVRDNQNVHTAPVSRQTNESVDRLLAVDIPDGQQTEISMVQGWTHRSAPPKIGRLIRVLTDVNRWFNQTACRTNGDRLYQRILRGLVALINKQGDEARQELYQRLWEECYESVNMCCEGHISRLCNVMVGFDDAFQPPVSIGEVLQAKMAMIAGLDVATEAKHTQALAVMNELGIPAEQRQPWLDAF
jgi:hypothetical protein